MAKNFLLEIYFIILFLVLKFKSPKLTALMIYISLRKLKGIKKVDSNKKIMILEKSFGIEDIKTAFSLTKIKYEPYVVPRRVFKSIFNLFFDNDEILGHNYVSSNKDIIKKKIKLREFYYSTLKEIKKFFNLKIIINFNQNYRAERELQIAAKYNDIKFICCQKESNFLDAEKQGFIDKLKNKIGKFEGDLMIVYSQRYKDLLLEAGIIDKKRIKVVGVTRADRFFNFRLGNNNQKHVLFNLIQTKRSLPKSLKINQKAIRLYRYLANASLKSTLKVAKKNPKTTFLFKTKLVNDQNTLEQQKSINKFNLKNCKIIFGGDNYKNIIDAKVIVGLNSTSLLEGLAAKKKVIVPYFYINNKNKKDSLMKFNNSVIQAKNPKKFEFILHKIINEKNYNLNLSKSAKKMLYFYIGNNDGKSYNKLANILNSL